MAPPQHPDRASVGIPAGDGKPRSEAVLPVPGGDARLLAAGAGVAAALWFGATWPRNPDFDATTVLEAWRALGTGALVVATAALLAVLASDGAAEALGRAAAALVRGVPPRARMPLVVAAATAAFATFTDVSLSGDALDIVRRTTTNGPPAADPLTALVHRGVRVALGIDAWEAVRWTSIAAGAVFSGLAVAAARDAFPDGARRAATLALLLGAGPVALFFGSVETYAPVIAATLAFLVLALRRLDGRGPWWGPPLALGTAVALHGVATFLGAAAWILVLHESAVLDHRFRRVAAFVAVVAAPVAAAAASSHVLGVAATGPGFGTGELPFLPWTLDPSNLTYRYAILDAEHLVAALSVLLVCGPAAWALLAAGPAALRGRRDVALLLTALVPLAVLPFVWNVSYTLRRDWDLFSVAGVPLALLAARSGLTDRAARRDAVRVVALTAFAEVPFALSHHVGEREQRLHTAAVRHVLRTTGAGAATVAAWSARLAALDPKGTLPLVERAMADGPGRRPRETEAALRRALDAVPDDPFALRLLGEVLAAAGRADEAEAALRRALLHPRENLRPPARLAPARSSSGSCARSRSTPSPPRRSTSSPVSATQRATATAHTRRADSPNACVGGDGGVDARDAPRSSPLHSPAPRPLPSRVSGRMPRRRRIRDPGGCDGPRPGMPRRGSRAGGPARRNARLHARGLPIHPDHLTTPGTDATPERLLRRPGTAIVLRAGSRIVFAHPAQPATARPSPGVSIRTVSPG